MPAPKRYHVVQVATWTDLWGKFHAEHTGEAFYRWLWRARVSAFMHKGSSITGLIKYTTAIYDTEYGVNV